VQDNFTTTPTPLRSRYIEIRKSAALTVKIYKMNFLGEFRTWDWIPITGICSGKPSDAEKEQMLFDQWFPTFFLNRDLPVVVVHCRLLVHADAIIDIKWLATAALYRIAFAHDPGQL